MPMPTFNRIDMVVLYVRDWPAMLAWYTSTFGPFGLETAFVEPEHRFAVLSLPGGGPVIHLVGDTTRQSAGRNRCVANISVSDFSAVVSAVEALSGVEVVDL